MKKIRSRKDLKVIDLLIAHGPEGYGVYVMLTDYLSGRKALRSSDDIGRIAYELHARAELVRSVLNDFGLFECIDGEYFNESAQKKPSQSGVDEFRVDEFRVDESGVEELRVDESGVDEPQEIVARPPRQNAPCRKVSVKNMLRRAPSRPKPLKDPGLSLSPTRSQTPRLRGDLEFNHSAGTNIQAAAGVADAAPLQVVEGGGRRS